MTKFNISFDMYFLYWEAQKKLAEKSASFLNRVI